MPHPGHERGELVGLYAFSIWIEPSLSHAESAACRRGPAGEGAPMRDLLLAAPRNKPQPT